MSGGTSQPMVVVCINSSTYMRYSMINMSNATYELFRLDSTLVNQVDVC